MVRVASKAFFLKVFMRNIEVEKIKEKLFYDKDSGIFTWIKTGKIAGSVQSRGYVIIGLHGSQYLSHRLAWAMVYGKFPVQQIDHINQVKTDNRIENLRDVSQSENLLNQSVPTSNNTSGFRGVHFCKITKKYVAQRGVNYKNYRLGYFDTPEEAHNAYVSWRK